MNGPIRMAILIGAPGAGKERLRGVESDLQNMESFLRSARGGAWEDREVLKLKNPSRQQLFQLLARGVVDYLFVYFSGHGFCSGSTTHLWVNNEEFVDELALFNRSIRQLTILDSCRVRPGAAIGAIPQVPEEVLELGDRKAARVAFDRLIMQSPAGQTTVYAAQLGMLAYDSSDGGLFTTVLLDLAGGWPGEELFSPLYMEDMLPHTVKALDRGQTPEMICVSGDLRVPFALLGPVQGYRKPIGTEGAKKTQKRPLVAAIGVLALLLLINGDD